MGAGSLSMVAISQPGLLNPMNRVPGLDMARHVEALAAMEGQLLDAIEAGVAGGPHDEYECLAA